MEQATIPIVDDGPHVLVSLEAVLAADLRVLRAGASHATLKLLRTEHDVAVIATDYKMPP
jgi:response regulator RpfG family c-di-GMP phosphodiesterase